MRTILKNGVVHTMDEANTIVSAVLMEDSKIVATGSDEEIMAMAKDEDKIIDAEGKTVIPGFYDSHLHLLSYGYAQTMAYLDDCKCIDDVIETLKKYIADNNIPEGTWVEGRGWNEQSYPDGRMPNRWDLDKVSTKHMITIGRSCSFICVENSKALEELGFLDETPEVFNGQIEYDENGEMNGIFRAEAKEAVYSRLPKLGVAKIKESILAACNNYVKLGMTSVETDDFELTRAGTYDDILQAYKELVEEDALPIRINLMLYLPEDEQQQDFYKYGFKTGSKFEGPGKDFFTIGKFKLLTDGSLGVREAAMIFPYEDAPTYGNALLSQGDMVRKVEDAYQHGLVSCCDGMGDRGIYMALRSFEACLKNHPDDDIRFCIDHCQITTEGLIEDYARLGVIAGCELVFVKSDIEIAEARVGYHRASMSYNWKRFFDEGCLVVAGSDSPVEYPNPMWGIQGSVTRQDWDGLPKEGWFPDQKITVQQAMEAFTRNAAYANYEENIKGTIEPGKLADILILSDDLWTMDPEKINECEVLTTIVGGKVAYQA